MYISLSASEEELARLEFYVDLAKLEYEESNQDICLVACTIGTNNTEHMSSKQIIFFHYDTKEIYGTGSLSMYKTSRSVAKFECSDIYFSDAFIQRSDRDVTIKDFINAWLVFTKLNFPVHTLMCKSFIHFRTDVECSAPFVYDKILYRKRVQEIISWCSIFDWSECRDN